MRSKIDYVILDDNGEAEIGGKTTGEELNRIFNMAELVTDKLAAIDQKRFVKALERDLDRIRQNKNI